MRNAVVDLSTTNPYPGKEVQRKVRTQPHTGLGGYEHSTAVCMWLWHGGASGQLLTTALTARSEIHTDKC